jgi:hypothetical protein
MAFDPIKAQQDIAPSFVFERVGDGLKMLITDIDDTLELEDSDKGVVRGTSKFLAIKGEVLACTGGAKNKETDEVTDVPTGEVRSVLAQYEYKGIGKDTFSPYPKPIAKAIAKAITTSGARTIEVGGELRIKHHELGKRNADNPSWNRPKLYEATYTPPVKASAVLASAALGDGEDPF